MLPIAAQPGSLTGAAGETGSGCRNGLDFQSDRGRVSISHYFALCPRIHNLGEPILTGDLGLVGQCRRLNRDKIPSITKGSHPFWRNAP